MVYSRSYLRIVHRNMGYVYMNICNEHQFVMYAQIATDPKLAMQKAKELWATLSLPEPENQARPDTLEQLLVLLTRESARRIVHLVNGTAALAARTPRRLGHLLVQLSHQLLAVANASLQVTSTSLIRLKSYLCNSINIKRVIFLMHIVKIIERHFLYRICVFIKLRKMVSTNLKIVALCD